MADQPTKSAGILSSIFAIVAFIILIIIVIWGLVHLAGLTGDWFGRLFGGGKPSSITVIAPKETVAGEPFTVSWRYQTSMKGGYALLYQCKNDLTLKAGTAANQLSVPCGAAFTLPAGNNVSLTAYTKSASTTLPLSIIFLPSATSTTRAQGSALVVVHAASGTQTANAPADTSATTATTPTRHTPTRTTTRPAAARAVTPPDLAVRILAVGIIDPSTGMFVNRAPVSPNEMAAVEFDIANRGGSTSDTYYFEAHLPTTGVGYFYESPLQAPLHPGDHIVNTLRFTQMNPGGGSVIIDVDPSESTRDSNRSNNQASQWIGFGSYNTPSYRY